jgi:NAD(P)-dependent dehydrogenase (short-subunit alcohol dehydrogenase family)
MSRIGPCDVTDKTSLEKLIADISKKEDHIDLLITNAGISGPKAEPASEAALKLKESLFNSESFSEWSDTFNTNVSAVYFTTVAFLPLLQASKSHPEHQFSPSVIVISSSKQPSCRLTPLALLYALALFPALKIF